MKNLDIKVLDYYIKRCKVIGEQPTLFGYELYYNQYKTVFEKDLKTA